MFPRHDDLPLKPQHDTTATLHSCSLLCLAHTWDVWRHTQYFLLFPLLLITLAAKITQSTPNTREQR
ncbi:hypothetical protein E2C01_071260 [Portunus trituberculatus]|uniref:Uncharacterized protein n=1 Tax=Portunus trituberculatus TaxID=210409 RepID=A0A5B7I5R1_PORTR|nr:hypothetical protein [Portunus trituberculatus]